MNAINRTSGITEMYVLKPDTWKVVPAARKPLYGSVFPEVCALFQALLCLSFFSISGSVFPRAIFNSAAATLDGIQVNAGPDQHICVGDTVQLQATGALTYQWSPAAGLSCATCSNPLAFPDITTKYFVTGNDGSVDSVTIFAAVPPIITSVIISNTDNCIVDNGGILVNVAGNTSDYEYSIDGGNAWQPSNSFLNLSAGNYSVIANVQGVQCLSSLHPVTLTGPVCVDTVFAVIPENTTTEFCLSSVVFQIAGTPTAAGFCSQGNVATVFAPAIASTCLTLVPAAGFTGTSPHLICTIHCFDNSTVCDTTIIKVSVSPADCNAIFIQDTAGVAITGDPTPYCVPLAPMIAANYQLVFDGENLNDLQGCDYDSVIIYSYGFLQGGGFNGPYTLDAWFINGVSYDGFFTNVNDLVDLMNFYDAAGNWQLNTQTAIIFGGVLTNDYGNMEVTHVPTASGTILNTNFSFLPNGFLVNLHDLSPHAVVAIDPATGCADTLIINPALISPLTDTVYLTTLQEVPANIACVDGLELPGGTVGSLSLCALPGNGTVVFTGDSCLVYQPGFGFSGTDTFCVVVCDSAFPQICDSTTFIVQVAPAVPCDDIFTENSHALLAVNDTSYFCIPVFLNAIGNMEVRIDGLPVAAPFGACGEGEMVVYDYAALPSGLYFLNSWSVNGNLHSGLFANLNVLVDSMNLWDPAGNWVNLPVNTKILGGNGANTYSNMVISLLTGGTFTIVANPAGQPSQSLLTVVGVGQHELIISAPGGCADTILLLVNNYAVSTDTIFLGTDMNTSVGAICLETTELLGTAQNLTLCGLPLHGNVTLTSDTCFYYTPALNFVGVDAFCAVLCDDNLPVVCDTFIIVVSVESTLGTLAITTFEDVPSQVVCLDTSGLSGNFSGLSLCGAPSSGTIFFNENCFTYNPANGFVGQDAACLLACDGQGQCDTTLVQITVEPLCSLFDIFPPDVQTLEVNDCLDQTAYCVALPMDSLVNYGILDNGFPYSGSAQTCDAGNVEVTLDTGFHELVFINMGTGCTDTLWAEVLCQPAPTGCGTAALSPAALVAADCDGTAQFCVDLEIIDLSNFLITTGGQPSVDIAPCGDSGPYIGVPLDTGFHQLIFTDTTKGCADTFYVAVSCIYQVGLVVDTSLMAGDSAIFCLGDFGYTPATLDSLTNPCAGQGTGNAIFTANAATACVTVYGISTGTDSDCFGFYFSDTLVTLSINVVVNEPCQGWFAEDTLATGVGDCLQNPGLICLPFDLNALQNLEILVDGATYTGALPACAFDSVFQLNYSAFPGMGLAGPYIVESWSVNGSIFTGVFGSAQELAGAMSLWDPNGDWAVFIDPFTQAITISGGSSSSVYGVMVVQQSTTGIKVQLGISGVYVPSGHGLFLPFGFHQIVVTDTLKGCTDSVVALVACVNSDVVENTILTGELDSLCLDFSELPGTPSEISNICPGSAGEIAAFSINGGCVFYFGNEPGLDSACIVVCDDWGVCDTTFLFVTVVAQPTGDSVPVAVNDTIVSQPGHGIVIDVFANDTIHSLQQFFILDPPGNGQAVFLPGGSINYLPGQDYCDDDVPDMFSYVVCNPAGCDTATVFITVQCTGVEVFNGFSPNGDGVNDFFQINGLQNYPGHRLQVYNRWGNLVFAAVNYQNTWDGKWKNQDLPDGTYFYYLDLGDGSKPLSGYVELHR